MLTAGIVLPSPRRSAGSVILELNGLTPGLPFQTLGHLMVCRRGMMREARTMKHVKLTEHNNGCRTRRRAMDHYQLYRDSGRVSDRLQSCGDARKAALRSVSHNICCRRGENETSCPQVSIRGVDWGPGFISFLFKFNLIYKELIEFNTPFVTYSAK